jgi:hypothetical protein
VKKQFVALDTADVETSVFYRQFAKMAAALGVDENQESI